MRILFLDFHGVLAPHGYMERVQHAGWEGLELTEINRIDPRAVAVLNQVVEGAGCEVVVSSSRRSEFTYETLQRMLRHHGFEHTLLGMTTDVDLVPGGASHRQVGRGLQIGQFLSYFMPGVVESFVILDDSNNMEPHMDRLYRVDRRVGLQAEDVPAILEFFNKTKEM